MDQEKIGKFIAQKRKEQKLTQVQLAEKIGITDRAISKWENGKAMPDSSIMIELCQILKISVNELLEGEEVKKENYLKVAEENLMEMKKNEEKIKKRMKLLEGFFTMLCLFLSLLTIGIFILHMVMNYWMPETYTGTLFEALSPMCIILCFAFCLTASILKFQEGYTIYVREKETFSKEDVVQKGTIQVEVILKWTCVIFSIIMAFLVLLLVLLKEYALEIYQLTGMLGIFTIVLLWSYLLTMQFNAKYSIRKK